jgi:hypothetical protein
MNAAFRTAAKLALATALLLAVNAAPAAANHSWGGYHWARTSNPFTVTLGDNVSGAWDASLSGASTDWSASTVLDSPVVSGTTTGRKCRASSGRVQVCNAGYGYNGWLGLASVWTSGGHIVQATVKLNDSYYGSGSKYNTAAWRRSVTCQEIGHTYGLDHQSEDPNVDMNTCMDYCNLANVCPNISPNAHDYAQLSTIYNHTDSTTTLAASAGSSARGLRKVKDSLFVEDLGNGKKRFVWVYWKDRGLPHGPPSEG